MLFISSSNDLKKVHIHTFYKARKNIEANVCTNQRIYLKTQTFWLIQCYAAKLTKQIKILVSVKN